MTTTSALDCASPSAATRTFCEAVNSAELQRACACFTRDACLVTPDGTSVQGRAAIGGILAQLIASGVEISVDVSAVLKAGDVALAHEHWSLRSGDREALFLRGSRPTLVLRRIDSQWKLAVAAPWGWGE